MIYFMKKKKKKEPKSNLPHHIPFIMRSKFNQRIFNCNLKFRFPFSLYYAYIFSYIFNLVPLKKVTTTLEYINDGFLHSSLELRKYLLYPCVSTMLLFFCQLTLNKFQKIYYSFRLFEIEIKIYLRSDCKYIYVCVRVTILIKISSIDDDDVLSSNKTFKK